MRWPWSGDHPRSRGVYNKVISKILVRNGSSPLARGLPMMPGITGMATTDHPRSRGVYPARARSSSAASGSSPLARGLRVACFRVEFTRGIIPARAGFT